jgi:hypothetical protein
MSHVPDSLWGYTEASQSLHIGSVLRDRESVHGRSFTWSMELSSNSFVNLGQ